MPISSMGFWTMALDSLALSKESPAKTGADCGGITLDDVAHWFAAHTCANHEKSVAAQLQERCVEHFLPLYETVHRWKDRRVRICLPLFPGYVFVRIAMGERLNVLRVPGVAQLVCSGQKPVPLLEGEIETLRRGLDGNAHPEPHPFLTTGRRVRVIRGALAGMEGVLLRVKSNFRLIVSIEAIGRSIAVDIDSADVHLLAGSQSPQSAYGGIQTQFS